MPKASKTEPEKPRVGALGEAELCAMLTRALAMAAQEGGIRNAVLIIETGEEPVQWCHPWGSLSATEGLVMRMAERFFAGEKK